jgi:uncharacterized membrane protein YhiD involved in acid resistance
VCRGQRARVPRLLLFRSAAALGVFDEAALGVFDEAALGVFLSLHSAVFSLLARLFVCLFRNVYTSFLSLFERKTVGKMKMAFVRDWVFALGKKRNRGLVAFFLVLVSRCVFVSVSLSLSVSLSPHLFLSLSLHLFFSLSLSLSV